MRFSRLALCQGLLWLVAGFGWASSAYAQLLIQPAFNYQELEQKAGAGGKAKRVQQVYNISAAYLFGNGFHLGLKYYSAEFNSDSAISDGSFSISDNDRVQERGAGLTLGYDFGNGFFLAFSYLFHDVHEKGPSYRYDGDRGEVIDLGYQFKLGSVGIGPQFSLSKLYYDTYTENGSKTDLEGSWYKQRLLPYVGIWWQL